MGCCEDDCKCNDEILQDKDLMDQVEESEENRKKGVKFKKIAA